MIKAYFVQKLTVPGFKKIFSLYIISKYLP